MINHDLEIEKQAHPENFKDFYCECKEGVVCDECTDEDCECSGHPAEELDSYGRYEFDN
jgi:hypothetical protein